MSRIGRMPIAVPAGVTVDIAENNKVTVKGPKGELTRVLPEAMDIKKDGEEIVVTRPNDLKKNKALHGLTRTLIYNMVVGVGSSASLSASPNKLNPIVKRQINTPGNNTICGDVVIKFLPAVNIAPHSGVGGLSLIHI